ncbi:uncharacterized protein LOC113214092 [Frankliniella occidentalis]|uniref:Uncharacterized protein LOC113214092 n=1 Tax=Frankliniella occidentalis TaxID=133901 RepID=A0A6J1T6A4_FRAOC|nr:uncharacterized protein LOC113214092 [Frankliniella occidentalis]
MPQHCLVHWVNESTWDVLPITKVPSEHRFVGALSMLTWTDGEEYLGKIVAINSDMDKIEAEERKLYKEMKEKEKANPSQKRKSKERKKVPGVASEKEVRKALGEKPVLSGPQEAAKKLANAERKKKEQARMLVEKSEDGKLLETAVKKRLDFNEEQPNKPSSEKPKPSHDLMSDEEIDSDVELQVGKDVPLETAPVDLPAVMQVDELVVAKNSGNENEECGQNSSKSLKELFGNFNTEQFLRALMTELGFESEPPPSITPSKSSDGFAKPQMFENQKMVPLKKGFTLLILKSGRNKLIVDTKSQKTPTVFVRKTLTELYGEDQLSQMTALGRKRDKLGISPHDLNAIYGFVNDHCNDKITWKEFITCINKKCGSIKSPLDSSKSKKASSTKSIKSPKKTVGSSSPKKSPLKSVGSNTPKKSPRKVNLGPITPKKTPNKTPAEQFIVTDIGPAPPTATVVPNASDAPMPSMPQSQQWLWPTQRQNAIPNQQAAVHHLSAPTYPEPSAAQPVYQQQQSNYSHYYQQNYPQQTFHAPPESYYPQYPGWDDRQSSNGNGY